MNDHEPEQFQLAGISVGVEAPTSLDLYAPKKSDDDHTLAIIDLDVCPNFVLSKNVRIPVAKITAEDVIEKSYNVTSRSGESQKIFIKPAMITRKKISYFAYPGTREEIVELALRQIATSRERQQGVFLEPPTIKTKLNINDAAYIPFLSAGVMFKYQHLRDILRDVGCEMNHTQIKDAIEILLHSRVKSVREDGTVLYDEPYLSSHYERGQIDNVMNLVVFNPSTSQAIYNGDVRQIWFSVIAKANKGVTRYLLKYLTFHWLNASIGKSYEFNCDEFIKNSQLQDKTNRESNRRIREAMDELISLNVLESWELKKKIKKRGSKQQCSIMELIPHKSFVSEVISANTNAKKMREQRKLLGG